MTAPETSTPSKPLEGCSVLVTRSSEQAAGLAEPLERLGAEVVYFPVIEVGDPVDVAPLDEALGHLDEYDWLVLTSGNGVDRFFDRLAIVAPGKALGSVRVAVVGSATAAALMARGFEPSLVPGDYRAEGLVAEFEALGVGSGTRVLVARAQDAREVLPEALREMGSDVDVVVSYRVVSAKPDPAIVSRLQAGEVDVAAFASGGTFARFLSVLDEAGLDSDSIARSLRIASIGPVTTAAILSAGHTVAVEAAESTMESLAAAIAEFRTGEGTSC